MSATEGPEAIEADVLRGVPHAFFTRRGGVSTGIYAGLNCGPGSKDDPAAVAENRARAAGWLGVAPDRLLSLWQVHSARAVRASGSWGFGARPEADGIATDAPGLAVSALAADCAPVLFADAGAGVVAAAHAGWRGALDGVLGATVDLMVSMGADRGRIAAAVGPCISQRAYEVGPEFVDRFVAEDPGFARFFAAGAADRAMFDLPGFCLERLRDSGLDRVEWVGRCTYGDADRFFSYRRATHAREPDYGRLLSAIRRPD
jgi:YfiH family protein